MNMISHPKVVSSKREGKTISICLVVYGKQRETEGGESSFKELCISLLWVNETEI
jgi:hypothetical protein